MRPDESVRTASPIGIGARFRAIRWKRVAAVLGAMGVMAGVTVVGAVSGPQRADASVDVAVPRPPPVGPKVVVIPDPGPRSEPGPKAG